MDPDELLRTAVDRARAEDADCAADPHTRARVLRTVQHRRARARGLTVTLAAAVSMLAGSTAWAAHTGTLEHAWAALSNVLVPANGPQSEEPRATEATPPGDEPPSPSAHSPDASASAPTIAEGGDPSASTVPPDLRTPPESGRHPTGRDRGPRTRSSERPPRELTLYRRAHRAHFVHRAPERALAAWRSYLRRFPEGRFAPEARYNRALTLIRLERWDRAALALQPFADGRYGHYRRREARELLDALHARSSQSQTP
jgi:TolA-binding protein